MRRRFGQQINRTGKGIDRKCSPALVESAQVTYCITSMLHGVDVDMLFCFVRVCVSVRVVMQPSSAPERSDHAIFLLIFPLLNLDTGQRRV